MALLRWGAGHISQATIEGSASYLIVNFPVQSDQNWPWFEPQWTPIDFFRRSPVIGAILNEDGPKVMSATFERLTGLQLKYIETTFLTQNSGAWGPLTILWPEYTGDLDAYQGILHKPDIRTLQPTDRRGMAVDRDVYYNVRYDFVNGISV